MELVVPGGLIIKNDGVSQLQYATEEVQKVVEFRGVLLVVGYNNHNPKIRLWLDFQDTLQTKA